MFEKSLIPHFLTFFFISLALTVILTVKHHMWALLLILFGPIWAIGFYDLFQTSHAVLRNFPVLGHMRFILLSIRPEIRQYFIESDTDGRPFNRKEREVVYQRARDQLDTIAFGSLESFYEVGYEWVNHSLAPVEVNHEELRIDVGGPLCSKPYNASIMNVSAMSYGSLSGAAVRAINGGAKIGNFSQNTGEGGLSPHHLAFGGDLVWQLGTGYFGARTPDGNFDADKFREKAQIEEVKMIELKLSQGAKPGHGGILPGRKVTPEIASIRGIEMGHDVISPPGHKAFHTPIELCEFIQKLRELSGGKPVGFKLCIGKRREFIAICKAMVVTQITPDFITIDGAEGGTGAAPLEFADRIGCPSTEALIFAHNALVGFGLRKKLRLIHSGKVASGFAIIKRIALGADMVNAARSFMQSIGCIQALKCNKNVCPVGVTTTNPILERGLHVGDKRHRCARYHHTTLVSVAEILGAMGLAHSSDLRPWHIMRRSGPTEIRHHGEIYHYLAEGDLLNTPLPPHYARACEAALAETFDHAGTHHEGKLADQPPKETSYGHEER